MTRVEIIANQSVQEEIVALLEEHIEGVLYTIIPMVTGRGKKSYKRGDATWPETNFALFSYMEDSTVPTVRAIITAIKKRFPGEGVKVFFVKAEEL